MSSIPSGFELFPKDNSFNDVLAPLYYKVEKEGTFFGLRIEKHHCNPMGICHGGVFMTLMDIALSASVCHSIEKYIGTPTISLSMDFLAPGQLHDWIWADVETLKITNTMGFSQGVVRNQMGNILMRANGNFKLPKDIATAKGASLTELLAAKGSSKE